MIKKTIIKVFSYVYLSLQEETKGWNGIPSNTILDKTITGLGATYTEIHACRHSVIIEPNVPVIIGKMKKHPFIFAVYEGVSQADIEAYLTQPEDGYRKIVTTPEGFQKVKRAMQATHNDMYSNYAMLFDECDKAVQDVGYRGDICLPFDDFFKFRNKAMVSATPIIPSDPRFEGFELVKFEPKDTYCKQLELITTNNTVAQLRKKIEETDTRITPICIFVNSIDLIYNLMCTLKIVDRSKVFCSEKAVRKLKGLDFSNAYEYLEELAEINFFTSRFYSALDIELNVKPNVILFTNVTSSTQTVIDPQTEAVQIVGRFRNGVKDIIHITNLNSEIEYRTREEQQQYLEECEDAFLQIHAIKPKGNGGTATRQQAIDGTDYKRFMNADGTRNYFMWDNSYFEEQIKSYYQDADALISAYNGSIFNIDHHDIKCPITDEDRLKRVKHKVDTKEFLKEIVRQLELLSKISGTHEYTYLIEELSEQTDLAVEAFYILGKNKMEELKYDHKRIRIALEYVENNRLLVSEAMQQGVYAKYKVGDTAPVRSVNAFMKKLATKNGIPYKKEVDITLIKLFFEVRTYKSNKARKVEFLKKRF